MNSVRYFVAVFIIVAWVPAFAHWFLIHPFANFWRRLGPRLTYMILIPPLLAVMVAVFLVRDRVLVGDYGTNLALLPAALVIYAAAVYISLKVKRHLTFRILVGVPEVHKDPAKSKLLTDGIYAKVRHPRYVALVFGMVAFALFTNYLTVYLIVPATILTVYLLTLLEEKELRDRFGDEYVRYSQRVPRFVPRWRGLHT